MTTHGYIRVRIKATGQVIDMVPEAAFPKINAGIAERLAEDEEEEIECAAIEPQGERADARAQAGLHKKHAVKNSRPRK